MIFENSAMTTTPLLASYVRSHRLKSGLSQQELAEIVGILAHHQVSVHERAVAVPSLIAAFSYQAVFRVSVAELFPGLYEPISQNIEGRLAEMEKRLQDSDARGRSAQAIARKLEWLCSRRDSETDAFLE
jgi:DNA-binding XRE family transcriptional regulator